MNVIQMAAALLFAAGSASAFTPTAEEKRCAAGVYCADMMVCVGTIKGEKPRGMHPSHYWQILTVKAFKSVKNLPNGQKTLVDSLAVGEDSVGEHPITLEQAKAQATEGSWYGAPATIRGKRVTIGWGGGFSEGYQFRITSSKIAGGQRIDTLKGTQKVVGSVVADHTWSYDCEAVVVEAPSTVVDLTR